MNLYEKYREYGSNSLSNDELLSVILRVDTSVANDILNCSNEYDDLLACCHTNVNQLEKIQGIGSAKACQLSCVVEFSKRLIKATRKNKISLNSPDTVASYYMEDMRHLTREQVLLVMVNTKNKIIAEKVISSGTINSSIVSPREIFLEAVKNEAVYIILLHNHPSGDPTPSTEDLNTTKRVKDAGKLIGIELLDHIIIGDNDYVSLKKNNIL